MAILIEEQFQVEVPVERVWAYLSDPPRVAPCLPGAQLTDIVDDRTYKGQVKVQVGPVVAQYQGTVTVEAMDADSHTATMVGRGTQIGAAGRAEGRMTYTLRPIDGQGTEIAVNAEVNVTGRLAQLGGGMIQSVSKQLFKEFVECVRQQILAEQAASVEASPAAETSAPAQEAPVATAPVAPSP
ncbi:MAG TPA: membrane oxidoreductase, partial [Chloroflexi bacterium]|nr:membrane oxidoreductase [Chloroflexota bacterium]